MEKPLACLCLAALLLPPRASAAAAQDFPPDSAIQAMIEERVEAVGAVGIAVGVLEADGTIRTFEAGSAGAGRAPLGPLSVFEIGSITKVFTGTLLAEMARRGEVRLEDPVRMYLPETVVMPARNGEEIRLVDLATHRSGLPRMPSNFRPADPTNPYADYTPGLLYGFLTQHRLRRDIGAEGEYSNLGVGLLGHALARRLGVSYEEAIRERILAPLGMDMTGIVFTPEMEAVRAAGHNASGGEVSPWDIATLEGAGALRSNVRDMLRFLGANVGPPTTELERAMRDAHAPRDSLGGMAIGLNWITRTTDGQRTVWHNGGTGGFRAFAGFDPDRGIAVVVLSNSSIGADDIGFHLLNPALPLAPVLPLTAGTALVALGLILLAGVMYAAMAARLSRTVSPGRLLMIWIATAIVFSILLDRLLLARYAIGLTGVTWLAILVALVVLPTAVPTFVAHRRARREPRGSMARDVLLTSLSFPAGLALGVTLLVAMS